MKKTIILRAFLIMMLIVILPGTNLNAKPAGACQQKPAAIIPASSAAKGANTTSPVRTYILKPGDTLMNTLTAQGISAGDALLAAKKVDRKILRKIQPGGEISLVMNNSGTAVKKITYALGSSPLKVLYAGRELQISAAAALNTQEILSNLWFPAEEYLIGFHPAQTAELESSALREHIEQTAPCIFNASAEVQAELKKALKKEQKRIEKERLAMLSKKEKRKKFSGGQQHRHGMKSDPAGLDDAPAWDNGSELSDYSITALREKLVTIADKFQGVPYRRGQATENGTDCSGLTLQIYEALGYKIPRSSQEQFLSGKPVGRDHIRKGDLVFFSTEGRHRKVPVSSPKKTNKKTAKLLPEQRNISHVGIYIGDGKFIHAPRTGQKVCIESMDTPYFKKRYAGARTYLR